MPTPHVHYIMDGQYVRPATRPQRQASRASRVGQLPARARVGVRPDFIARPVPTRPRPKPKPKNIVYDVTLRELEEGRGQNFVAQHSFPQSTLSQAPTPHNAEPRMPRAVLLTKLGEDRTVTFKEEKNLPKPFYYDPKTGTAYTPGGVFLAGMGSLVRHDVNPADLSLEGKLLFYGGEAVEKAALGFGASEAVGAALSTRAGLNIVTKAAEFGARHPRIVSAARGVLKGLLIGGEAAKGIMMKEKGSDWLDVGLELGTDFAGFYGFDRGLSATVPRVRVVKKRFLEGTLTQTDVYKGENLVESVKLLSKQTPEGHLVGISTYRPNEGTIYTISVRGTREVDMRMANVRGAFDRVFKTSGMNGIKFWKASEGGTTRFYLYDPPRLQSALKVNVKEVPGLRTNLMLLRPTPFARPPSASEILRITGADSILAMFGRQPSAKTRNTPKQALSSPKNTQLPSPRLKTPDFETALRTAQNNEGLLKFDGVLNQGIERQIPKPALVQVPRTRSALKTSQLLETKELLDFDGIELLSPRVLEETTQRTETLLRTAQLLSFSMKKRQRTALLSIPSFRSKELTLALDVGVPDVDVPPLDLLIPHKKKKKKRKAGKKSRKSRKKDIFEVILGEIDLFSANELDARGITNVDISVKKFSQLWNSGDALLSEPYEVLKATKVRRKRGKRRKRPKKRERRRKR